MQLSDKGKAALRLAAQGWKVFPLVENGKTPLVSSWEEIASDDPIKISNWWEDGAGANIGLATGPSGLLVLDFDSAKDPNETSGIENFRQTFKRKLPDTFTVGTPSGGWHLYYLAGTAELRNTAGKLATRVDTRAQGGYVVAPGSVIDGGEYKLMLTNKPAVPAPPWVIQELNKPTRVDRSAISVKGSTTAYARAALNSECQRVKDTGEGGRNHATNRAAWNVSRFVAKGELDYEVARSAIIQAAEDAGLSKREAGHATASGLQRGIKHYGDS